MVCEVDKVRVEDGELGGGFVEFIEKREWVFVGKVSIERV